MYRSYASPDTAKVIAHIHGRRVGQLPVRRAGDRPGQGGRVGRGQRDRPGRRNAVPLELDERRLFLLGFLAQQERRGGRLHDAEASAIAAKQDLLAGQQITLVLDGFNDLAAAVWTSPGLVAYIGAGNGTFLNAMSVGAAPPYVSGVVSADLDADTNADLVGAPAASVAATRT